MKIEFIIVYIMDAKEPLSIECNAVDTWKIAVKKHLKRNLLRQLGNLALVTFARSAIIHSGTKIMLKGIRKYAKKLRKC